MLVRESAQLDAPPGVVVRRGDATDRSVLEDALAGRDAVLSALGLRRAGRSPWAPLRSPPDLTTRVARALVPAMRRHGVARLVAISAAGVGDSFERLTWPVRRLVRAGNVGVAYRDLESMEAVLEASDLDWLVVRPVTLVDGASRGAARPVDRYGLLSTIRRSEVGEWMLCTAERPGRIAERRVMLGS